jgi:hypothetical protein
MLFDGFCDVVDCLIIMLADIWFIRLYDMLIVGFR